MIVGTLTGNITMGRRRSWSNGNEGVLHTSQISRTGTSPSDAILCYTKDIPFMVVGNVFIPWQQLLSAVNRAVTGQR